MGQGSAGVGAWLGGLGGCRGRARMEDRGIARVRSRQSSGCVARGSVSPLGQSGHGSAVHGSAGAGTQAEINRGSARGFGAGLGRGGCGTGFGGCRGIARHKSRQCWAGVAATFGRGGNKARRGLGRARNFGGGLGGCRSKFWGKRSAWPGRARGSGQNLARGSGHGSAGVGAGLGGKGRGRSSSGVEAATRGNLGLARREE